MGKNREFKNGYAGNGNRRANNQRSGSWKHAGDTHFSKGNQSSKKDNVYEKRDVAQDRNGSDKRTEYKNYSEVLPEYHSRNMHYIYNKEYFDGIFEAENGDGDDKFANCKLKKCTYNTCNIHNCKSVKCELVKDANEKCDLKKCKISNCTVRFCRYYTCRLIKCDLEKCGYREIRFKENGKRLVNFTYPITVWPEVKEIADSDSEQTKENVNLDTDKEQTEAINPVPFVSNLIDNMETAYGKLKETSNGSLHENDNVNSEKMPDNAPDENAKLEKAFVQIKMKTTYPGLLIGLGYPHDSKERGAIAGGFSFDYTTGLPYIPGSTVKGMLRSYFPGQRTKNKEAYRKFIAQILYASLGEPEGDVQWDIDKLEKYVDTLEELLFEEDNIYLGGYPLLDEKSDKKILAEEFITPHKPLKNPNVINILKVKPGVKFGFLFVLHACKLGDIPITVEQIKTFFEQILELGGVGAKTNVGYSQFELCENKQ